MTPQPSHPDFQSPEDWLDPHKLAAIFGPQNNQEHGKRVLIAICGGIAAYKICTLVSRLAQAGAQVTVAMTQSATQFVTPLTFQALSGNPVYTSQWNHPESSHHHHAPQHHATQHISLAGHTDVALVAPCTMNTLSDIAQGRADSTVSLILSAIDRTTTPVLIAPAMNEIMWNQPANQRNIKLAQDDGNTIIVPDSGWQACRHEGAGRMPEPATLIKALAHALPPQ